MPSAKEIWETLALAHEESDHETHIGFTTNTIYNSTLEESLEEVNLFDIHNIKKL